MPLTSFDCFSLMGGDHRHAPTILVLAVVIKNCMSAESASLGVFQDSIIKNTCNAKIITQHYQANNGTSNLQALHFCWKKSELSSSSLLIKDDRTKEDMAGRRTTTSSVL